MPIEIKSAKTYSSSFTKSLHYFAKLLPDKIVVPHIIYDGEKALLSDGIKLINFKNFHL